VHCGKKVADAYATARGNKKKLEKPVRFRTRSTAV
jgi:hypothetical protein